MEAVSLCLVHDLLAAALVALAHDLAQAIKEPLDLICLPDVLL